MIKFGLIGHPIEHSASPALFAKAYGGRWQYDLIEGEDFEASWQRFLDEYQAINITAPFKEAAFRKVAVNQMIPPELYKAVAEILLFVYKMKGQVDNAGRMLYANGTFLHWLSDVGEALPFG